MNLASSASAAPERRSIAVSWGGVRRRLFGISPDEARFERRGFAPGADATQRRLEHVGRTFVGGYLAGLEHDHADALPAAFSRVVLEDRGFAFEGAAMAVALLDLLTPWKRDRLGRYLAGAGEPHMYMVHVGAGWALARLGRGPRFDSLPLDPLLRWLALDGYGFHEGYFAWRRTLVEQRRPVGFHGYAARAFDQGLGRSLWFVEAGDPARIAHRIAAFPVERRADLWSGIGLAATYAGGVPAEALTALRSLAGAASAHLAQGAAFAAQAREHAGNPAAHTELACEILTGRTAEAAARVTDQARAELPADREAPAYEEWRTRIRERIAAAAGNA